MKQILPLLLALAGFHAVFSQNAQPRILCGNEVFSKIVREQYPALQAAFDQTFDQAQHASGVADRSPLNIKVVVHVVWNAAAENLADSVIESQIRVLNEDFNRMNADTGRLRARFGPVAGNADIHFQLADIVRVKTSKLFSIDLLGGKLLPEVKHANQGGSDARDPEKYLNLWVCKIQPTTIFGIPVGQIFGFAFPPNGLSHWPAGAAAPQPEEDGVVIDFRMMGRNNPNTVENPATGEPLTVRGRTPVHEVAHYLGLRHIWGDGGLLGPNDCAQSDGVDDTPYANAQSDFDCDTTRNTCEQVEMFFNADPPDLVENFMDYSSEACMNMFTKGQVAIMRNVLTGPRKGLLETSSTVSPTAGLLSWRISPNPASGAFFVDFESDKTQDFAYRVFNAQGKTVFEQSAQTFPPGTHRIGFESAHWPAGMYFVEMKTEAGSQVRKLVKN